MIKHGRDLLYLLCCPIYLHKGTCWNVSLLLIILTFILNVGQRSPPWSSKHHTLNICMLAFSAPAYLRADGIVQLKGQLFFFALEGFGLSEMTRKCL